MYWSRRDGSICRSHSPPPLDLSIEDRWTGVATTCGAAATFRKALNALRQGSPRLARRSKQIEKNEVLAYAGLTFWRYSMRSGLQIEQIEQIEQLGA
jgi:hypothetical protein